MESICAVLFTLILVFPLVLQLQMLILDPKKLCAIFRYYATNIDDDLDKVTTPKLLQHYPKGSMVFDETSHSNISVTNLRSVSSSPVMTEALPSSQASESPLPAVKHSCTFVKTDQVLPVVDITWTYSSYRYKALESCLRDRYGDKYPPGDVVFNSMQLNLLDSRTKVADLADLFDFVKDSQLTLNGEVAKTLEIDYLDPMDHFVAKSRTVKPFTEDRCTETLRAQMDQTKQAPINDVVAAGPKKCTGAIRRPGGKIEPRNSKLPPNRWVHGTKNVPPSTGLARPQKMNTNSVRAVAHVLER